MNELITKDNSYSFYSFFVPVFHVAALFALQKWQLAGFFIFKKGNHKGLPLQDSMTCRGFFELP